jgi:hypothetical protein
VCVISPKHGGITRKHLIICRREEIKVTYGPKIQLFSVLFMRIRGNISAGADMLETQAL